MIYGYVQPEIDVWQTGLRLTVKPRGHFLHSSRMGNESNNKRPKIDDTARKWDRDLRLRNVVVIRPLLYCRSWGLQSKKGNFFSLFLLLLFGPTVKTFGRHFLNYPRQIKRAQKRALIAVDCAFACVKKNPTCFCCCRVWVCNHKM